MTINRRFVLILALAVAQNADSDGRVSLHMPRLQRHNRDSVVLVSLLMPSKCALTRWKQIDMHMAMDAHTFGSDGVQARHNVLPTPSLPLVQQDLGGEHRSLLSRLALPSRLSPHLDVSTLGLTSLLIQFVSRLNEEHQISDLLLQIHHLRL